MDVGPVDPVSNYEEVKTPDRTEPTDTTADKTTEPANEREQENETEPVENAPENNGQEEDENGYNVDILA